MPDGLGVHFTNSSRWHIFIEAKCCYSSWILSGFVLFVLNHWNYAVLVGFIQQRHPLCAGIDTKCWWQWLSYWRNVKWVRSCSEVPCGWEKYHRHEQWVRFQRTKHQSNLWRWQKYKRKAQIRIHRYLMIVCEMETIPWICGHDTLY